MKSNKKIKNYIKSVEEFLNKKYGSINDEWQLQIDLLEDNLIMKDAVDMEIENKGILIPDRFGAMVKNPLIKTSIELQVKIQKCIEELGISPKSQGKLKSLDDNDSAEILSNLLS